MLLTDTAVRNAKPSQKFVKLSDGGGLYLLIQPHGTKLWRLAYGFGGKQKLLAFGMYPMVSLAEARVRRQRNVRFGPIADIPRFIQSARRRARLACSEH